jgi:sarcosine oxidase subunit alpha
MIGRPSRARVFVESGAWLRAQYFPRDGEADWLATVDREVTAVRAGAGVCEVSTLGKIDIQGDEAAEFRSASTSTAGRRWPVGKARYGIMLREDGFVLRRRHHLAPRRHAFS